MLKINLEIDDPDLIEWVNYVCTKTDLSMDKLILNLIGKYKSEHPFTPKNKSKSKYLIDFFQKEYQIRFNFLPTEEVDIKLVDALLEKVNRATEDEKTSVEVLQKAIVWYLYVHTSRNREGEKFPHRFKIFLEQEWLQRQCIEASNHLTIDFIKKIVATNRNPKDFIKATQRGDTSSSFEGVDVAQEWQSALRLAVDLLQNKKLPREARENTKIKGLFQTDIPTIEYIRKARKFLEETETCDASF